MSLTRRRVLSVAATTGGIALAGCTGGGNGAGGDGDGEAMTDGNGATVVTMVDTAFEPRQLTIEPGDTVEWVNEDGFAHDVTATQFHESAEDWDFAGDVAGGERTSHTFESAGAYEYYCTIHGKDSMCGVVLVGDALLEESLPCDGGGGVGY